LSNDTISLVVTTWKSDRLAVARGLMSGTGALGGTNTVRFDHEVTDEIFYASISVTTSFNNALPARTMSVCQVFCDGIGPVRLETRMQEGPLMVSVQYDLKQECKKVL